MRRALLALAWAAAPCAAQSSDAELEIEISGGYRGMQESAGEIFDRLLSAIDDSGGGRSVDSFDVLQGISGEVSTMQVAPDPNAIGVDITADTGLSAVAGSEMHVRAGGKFRGQFGDRATVTMGMLDVESLDGLHAQRGRRSAKTCEWARLVPRLAAKKEVRRGEDRRCAAGLRHGAHGARQQGHGAVRQLRQGLQTRPRI